jgi:hypothetical protein
LYRFSKELIAVTGQRFGINAADLHRPEATTASLIP